MEQLKILSENLMSQLGSQAPRVIGAFLLLFIGMIVVAGIAKGFEVLLGKTNIDEKIAKVLFGKEIPENMDVGKSVSKSLYYFLMLFVLVAFFQALGLTIITEPFNTLLNQVFQYIPQIVGAGILILVAWLVASLVKMGLNKGLTAISFDDKAKKKLKLDDKSEPTKSIAELAYGLVFLFFLPGILNALGLNGILSPVQNMMDKILLFIPNLVSAAIMLVIGYFIANLIGKIITNLLASVGLDSLVDRLGLGKSLGDLKASKILGRGLFVLIFLPSLIGALNALQIESLTKPATNMLNMVLTAIPTIFSASIILIVGYIIAKIARDVVTKVLDKVGSEKLVSKLSLTKVLGTNKLSVIGGQIIFLVILVPMVITALEMLQFKAISDPATNMLNTFMAYLPSVIGAAIIFIIGWFIAKIVRDVVVKLLEGFGINKLLNKAGVEEGKTNLANILGSIVYTLILIPVAISALDTLKFDAITKPATEMLNLVMSFIPSLIAAAIILLVGWFIAKVVRDVVASLLDSIGVNTIPEKVGFAKVMEKTSLSKILASVVYVFILIPVAISALDTLQMSAITEPASEMLNLILGMIPAIFSAIIILLIGFLLSKLAKNIVVHVLDSLITTEMRSKLGLSEINPSNILGSIVQIFILLPVVISALDALKLKAITVPATNMLNMILTVLPSIFAAMLIVTVAYIVGKFVGKLVTNLLTDAGFNKVLANVGLGNLEEGKFNSSKLVGNLIFIGIVLFSAIEAANLLGFEILSTLVSEFTVLSGQVIAGLAIFIVGLFLANIVGKSVKTSTGNKSNFLPIVAKSAVLLLTGAISLRYMGLANEIINSAFILTLGSIAVAVALAFGLGSREIAARELDIMIKSVKGEENLPKK